MVREQAGLDVMSLTPTEFAMSLTPTELLSALRRIGENCGPAAPSPRK